MQIRTKRAKSTGRRWVESRHKAALRAIHPVWTKHLNVEVPTSRASLDCPRAVAKKRLRRSAGQATSYAAEFPIAAELATFLRREHIAAR